MLPVLAWTVARSRLVCAELEAELMAGLLPAALLAGEGGYYLTALFSAVAVLKRLAPDTGPDSTSPVSVTNILYHYLDIVLTKILMVFTVT